MKPFSEVAEAANESVWVLSLFVAYADRHVWLIVNKWLSGSVLPENDLF